MKFYFFSIIVLSFLLAGCSNTNQENKEIIILENSSTEMSDELPQIIDVVELLSNPKQYDGKLISVTGTVTHVCKHSGKRLHLMGNDEKTNVRLEAGKIGKFERELEGSDIIAKGIFHREVVDEEYMARWSENMEKEGKGDHKSHEEEEEKKGKKQRYKNMMGETNEGYPENYWLEGVSFETKNL